jgi:hypothetical protein
MIGIDCSLNKDVALPGDSLAGAPFPPIPQSRRNTPLCCPSPLFLMFCSPLHRHGLSSLTPSPPLSLSKDKRQRGQQPQQSSAITCTRYSSGTLRTCSAMLANTTTWLQQQPQTPLQPQPHPCKLSRAAYGDSSPFMCD